MIRRKINGGCGGFGYTGRGRRRSQEHNYSGADNASKKGLCTDLVNNVFNYGHKVADNQFIKSLEKLFQIVGTKYRQVVVNNLNKTIKINIVTPVHSIQFLVIHPTREALVRTVQSKIQTARRA